MSLPDTNKSGTDVSSNSSWSVIEETEDSRNSSLQDILIQPPTHKIDGSDEDARSSDIENSFITIPEDAAWTADPNEHTPPPRKSKKRSKKPYAEPLSIVTIIASILTITGITLLCMLFPQDIDTQSYDQLHRTYIEVVSKVDESVPETINKTSEVLKVVQDADLLNKIHQRLECDDGEQCSCKEEDTCSADDEATVSDTDHDEFGTFAGKTEKKVSLGRKTKSKVTTKKAKKQAGVSDIKEEIEKTVVTPQPKKIRHPKTVTRTKAAPSNLRMPLQPREAKDQVNVSELKKEAVTKQKNVPVLQAAVLAPPQFSKIEAKLATPVDNQKADSPKSEQQPVPFASVSVTKKLLPAQKSAFDVLDRMTKRNDSQQRIEELRKKWESAGNEHRERIQLIKAEFKDEVQQAKQAEMASSQRALKIKIIRDKYVARLKMDKERYLAQLRRFREDKQRLIDDICLKVKQQTNQKDASVGNYAVLLDEYDFRQTLKNLQCNQSRSFYLESMNLLSPRDTPENLAKFQSGDDTAIDLDIPDVSTTGSSQNLTASYASKLLAEPKEKNNSSSQKRNETKGQQQAQALENASIHEDVRKTVSNESTIARSLSTLNKKLSNSTTLMRQKFAREEKREKTPLERLRALRNNKEDTWLEYDHEDNYSSSTNEETRVEEDRRNNNDSSVHATVPVAKEDDTSGEETENENSIQDPPSTEDDEGQFKVVIRRKGRKRDIYGAAFDENGQKIKATDMLKWGLERRLRSPQSSVLSKQDPKRVVKDKFSFKGPF
ncbi:unnamed protein product [Callosobruchus maculatus]|uniref:Uncharacterized protein n=1 Tax=Callosobruchus maculatus TaxID=64391 RepID=A0A653DNL1_CALMS|nr:unnamed protein product [Callosobruchus maculatus]